MTLLLAPNWAKPPGGPRIASARFKHLSIPQSFAAAERFFDIFPMTEKPRFGGSSGFTGHELNYVAMIETTPSDGTISPCLPRRHHWSIWRLFGAAGFGFFCVILLGGGVAIYRAKAQAALVAQIQANGGSVRYAHEPRFNYRRYWERGSRLMVPEPILKQLGPDFFSNVLGVHGGVYEAVTDPSTPLSREKTRAICAIAARFPDLRDFSMVSEDFSIADIANWPSLDRLECLELACPRLNDDDLKSISRLPRLVELAVASPAITDEGLAYLGSLTGLVELRLSSSQITDEGLKSLSKLQFEELALDSPKITDAGAFALSPQRKMVLLNLTGSHIGDRGVAHLAGGGKLQFAILNDMPLNGSCLTELVKSHRLSRLELCRTAVTDDSLAALAGNRVNTLDLADTGLTDECLTHLGQIIDLYWVQLARTKVTGVGARHLRSERAPAVDLTGAPVTSDGVKELAQAQIYRLVLKETPIGDAELEQLAGNLTIFELDAIGTNVTSAGVRRFHQLMSERSEAGHSGTILKSDFTYEELYPNGAGILSSADQSDTSPRDSRDAKPQAGEVPDDRLP